MITDDPIEIPISNEPIEISPPVVPVSEPVSVPEESNAKPVSVPEESNAKPLDTPPAPQPPSGRGRHPKGCVCGRCSQSKKSGKPAAPKNEGQNPPVSEPEQSASAPENGAKPDFSDVIAETAKSADADYGALSEIFFATGVGVATMIFGPEWQPRSPEEKATVTGPLAVYLKSKDISDLPPGVVLSIVCMAYAAPRFQATSTKQKLTLWWLWIKNKFFRGKG